MEGNWLNNLQNKYTCWSITVRGTNFTTNQRMANKENYFSYKLANNKTLSASKVREKCVGLYLGLEMGAACLEFIGRLF